jgi:hypothetical protein
VGLGSATGVHQAEEPGVCTTASITEEEFKKSMEESKRERYKNFVGNIPRRRLN